MADPTTSQEDAAAFPDDPTVLIQTLLPDAVWASYFTVPRLRAWLPAAGAWGVDPVLRLLTLPQRAGRLTSHDMSLDSTRFDLPEERRHYLEETGEQVAATGRQVLAILLRSEAWMRVFTEEEKAALQDRRVSSYDDKIEIAMVAGMTVDGRVGHAMTPMTRRGSGRLGGYGDWTISDPDDGKSRMFILEDFWRGYILGMRRRLA